MEPFDAGEGCCGDADTEAAAVYEPSVSEVEWNEPAPYQPEVYTAAPESWAAASSDPGSMGWISAASGPEVDPTVPAPEPSPVDVPPVLLPAPEAAPGMEIVTMGGYDLGGPPAASFTEEPAYANITEEGIARAAEAQRQAAEWQPRTPDLDADLERLRNLTPRSSGPEDDDPAKREFNRQNFGLWSTAHIPVTNPPAGTTPGA